MIGIPTPNVWPSLSYRLTCTGFPDPRRGGGGWLGVGVRGVTITGALFAAADDWTTVVGGGPPPDRPLPQAVSTTARAHASAPHDRPRAIIMIKRYVLFLSTGRAARRISVHLVRRRRR